MTAVVVPTFIPPRLRNARPAPPPERGPLLLLFAVPAGNPACWGGEYTSARCCVNGGEAIPSSWFAADHGCVFSGLFRKEGPMPPPLPAHFVSHIAISPDLMHLLVLENMS